MIKEYVLAVGAERTLEGKMEIKCLPLLISAESPDQATGYAYIFASKEFQSKDGWRIWTSPPQTLAKMRKIKKDISS